jgi:16S rRNA (cytidine1402-2'-O)-methyltransferase
MLVRECVEAGVEVTCLPGPTAFVPALVASGLPCDRFIFEGFLPHKKGRQKRLGELASEERTLVFYESPHRIEKLLGEIRDRFSPDRRVVVAREISKLHEEFLRGTPGELLAHFEERPPKGEIVVVVAGA